MYNIYAFYAMALSSLLLSFLMVKYYFKKYKSRNVYISKRHLDKFLNQNKHR
jgi:hypothetical protein